MLVFLKFHLFEVPSTALPRNIQKPALPRCLAKPVAGFDTARAGTTPLESGQDRDWGLAQRKVSSRQKLKSLSRATTWVAQTWHMPIHYL